MAIILPFPSSARQALIRRHAGIISGLSRDGGDRHLQRQLQIQAEAMARRGVAAELVAQDRKGLEEAIRAQLFRLGRSGGGVA